MICNLEATLHKLPSGAVSGVETYIEFLRNLERLFYGGKGHGNYGKKQNQADHLRLRMRALLG